MSEEVLAGQALMREFVANSPFGKKLGVELVSINEDSAELRLPFDESLVTAGDVVHGGAIGTLADTAATVAAWSSVDVSSVRGGATAALSINYLSPARGTGLTARARVLRRGRSLCFCEVDVVSDPDATPIAKVLATYSFSLVPAGGDAAQ